MLQLLFANLAYYRRTNVAVVLGVSAATAVLTGALLVGESVRYSLRKLALDRLGRIDELLVSDHFFREELAAELKGAANKDREAWQIEPTLLFPAGTLERRVTDEQGNIHVRRAAGVLALGIQDSFWELSDPAVRPSKPLADDEIIINEPVAKELGLHVGDTVTLRFSKLSQVPADSPLGRKTDRVQSLPEVKIAAILPAKSLGQFSLHPQQGTSRLVFAPLAAMQDALDQDGKVNAMFAAAKDSQPATTQEPDPLGKHLSPQLADYGVELKQHRRTFSETQPPDVIFDYYQLTSQRMMIEPEIEKLALDAWKTQRPERVLTYLANDIELVGANKKSIPYSPITAVQRLPIEDIPSKNPKAELNPGEIALNSWAADDLGAKIGDRIRVKFFEPESTHGREVETSAEFTVGAILRLTEPSQAFRRNRPAVFSDRPTPANDPDFTPVVAGITDSDSVQNWDAPFPFDRSRVRPEDDTYWENHRTTPKAYISLADGEKLWSSRFGHATSIRVAAGEGFDGGELEESLLEKLNGRVPKLGMEFQPIRRQVIEASSGTTPFDVLFLALSMFVIAAALMLVWLLFRLGVEQRVAEQGLLRAVGWSLPQTIWPHTLEGIVLAAAGAVLGAILGVGYAWVMIVGLRTWWIGAVTSPFLELRVSAFSLILGSLLGLVTAALTVWFAMRGMRRMAIRDLLAGKVSAAAEKAKARTWRQYIALALLVASIALLAVSFWLQGETQGIAALGSGGALLGAIMLKLRQRLAGSSRPDQTQTLHTLGELAFRNAGRNPTRSMATMSLMAAAVFMIIAVSAFRLAPSDEGVGGFSYLAESAEPIVHDLNSSDGRLAVLGDDGPKLRDTKIYAFRVQPGDDASCRNLYRPSQPRVLGVTTDFIHHFDDPQQTAFRWAASAAKGEEAQNPWQVLVSPSGSSRPVAGRGARGDGPAIPVVIDKNTAMYSLRLYRGIGETFEVQYEDGPKVTFRVVGLLAESVLQGNLLIGEEDFKSLFPEQSGYKFFLIQPDPSGGTTSAGTNPVIDILEDRLGEEGFDAVDARERLADLFAVQNTYISTFQTLGGLGLILGTFGLAAVQLRNVLERKGELALLRSVGFAQPRLLSLVLEENTLLLLGGLVSGVCSATIALLPQLITGGARPPWLDLLVTLGIVAIVGGLVSWWAARVIQRAPVIAALRGE